MNAAQYLQVLADAHGFTRTVETALGEAKTLRPARGDGPLALVLFVHAIAHPWLRGDAVFYGHVSITHVPTGLCVDGFKHPFTPKPPVRPCFRAELKARTWTLNKTQTAELTRDLVRSRFPWTKRALAKVSERREVKQ